MDNNMVYRIDQINVFPNYDPTVARTDSTFLQRLDTLYYRGLNIVYEKRPNLRPAILRQAVPLYPNYVYNSAQVNRAYTDLMSLGYFKSAKIEFESSPRVPMSPTMSPLSEHRPIPRRPAIRGKGT